MKAMIDSSGCLTVEPESRTEAFALQCWASKYWDRDLSEEEIAELDKKEVSLCITTDKHGLPDFA